MLAFDAERQDSKQHHPPDQEVDRERGGDRHVVPLAEPDLFRIML
jgi:hypothetical protein